MTIAKYFWDLNDKALKEAARAVSDPAHPQFSQRMVTLLSRCDKPKKLFAILPKKQFIESWPKIRSYWVKRDRRSAERDWWETLYEQMAQGNETSGSKGQPPAFFQKFGKILKEKRIEKGLNQQQLAHRTGLAQPVISHIEEGKKNMTLFTLMRLCKVLDIKTIELG